MVKLIEILCDVHRIQDKLECVGEPYNEKVEQIKEKLNDIEKIIG